MRTLGARTILLIVSFLAGLLPAAAQKAALVARDEEAVRNMTVALIKAPAGPSAPPSNASPNDVVGAGFIVAVREDRTYILTACHVLDELLTSAPRLVVELYDRQFFYADTSTRRRATCRAEPEKDDWDVISIPAKPSVKLPFDRIGYARKDYDIYVVGHPTLDLWQISGRPGIVTSRDESLIRYDSVPVLTGTSGGPILANNLRLLVGMQVGGESGRVNHALDISYLRDRLKAADIPCDLGPVLPPNPLTDLK